MRARRRDTGVGAAACAVSLVLAGWCSVADAATLRVTTGADGLAPPGGGCSLRAAIEAVNSPGFSSGCGIAGSGSNTIVLPAGRYLLTIAPQARDDNATGDLDITAHGALRITGAGSSRTTIDAAAIGDRVLSVSGTGPVSLSRLTITGGRTGTPAPGPGGTPGASCLEGGDGGDGRSAPDGGGIYNTGTLVLDRVLITNDAAGAGGAGGVGAAERGVPGCPGGAGGPGGNGGGIFNLGRLTLIDSSIDQNAAGAGGAGGPGGGGGRAGTGGAGGSGGGIYNVGALTVVASTIFGNRAGPGGTGAGVQGGPGGGAGGGGGSGGGIFSASGPLAVTNTTLFGNFAGTGGVGGGSVGPGGAGGSGGAIQVAGGPSSVLNATVARNGVGAGGSSASLSGAAGAGGGISVQSPLASYDMRLQNTIVASSVGSGCAADPSSAITDDGHNLSFGDGTCPGSNGDPKLGPLRNNGGPTQTMALGPASAAINQAAQNGGRCPAVDQRGVRRQGGRCDIGAFEFARPTIAIVSPRPDGSYELGSRVRVRFRCSEGGLVGLITSCQATLRPGHLIGTGSIGSRRFTVTAIDRVGRRTVRTVRYSVFAYINPMRAVRGLHTERIDMGVDYGGSGPILALGQGTVLGARSNDSGPGCLSNFCWPGGGIVVYRLTEGPYAGKYVYVTENITPLVRAGETVRAGQRIAILHPSQPDMEIGWGSSRIGRPLAFVRGHACPCGDPGGWSTIEGRNFNRLLVALGAPSGRVQPNPPAQAMPRGWPTWR